MGVKTVLGLCRIWFWCWASVCALLSPVLRGTLVSASCLIFGWFSCFLGQNVFGIASNQPLLHQFGRSRWYLSMRSSFQDVDIRHSSCLTRHVAWSDWKAWILSFRCRISCIQDTRIGTPRLSSWELVFYPYLMWRRIASSIGDGL